MPAVRKDHPEIGDEGLRAKAAAEKADAEVAGKVKKVIDVEQSAGLRGVEVDPTPNENYTLPGVTSGAPTPETDDGQAEQARKHLKAVETKATGVSGR